MKPHRLAAGARKGARLGRGALLRLRIRSAGGRAGSGLQVERGVLIRCGAHGGLNLGRGVYLGRGVVIDVPVGAALSIGSRSRIMHYTVLAAAESVRIGARTQIAEHCSIRDLDHDMALGKVMLESRGTTSSVTVGDDVWIAAGVRVLRGTTIGDGCVLGANAVARGAYPALSISVGAPARVVRYRVAAPA